MINDPIFTPDLMRFDATQIAPDKDYKGNPIFIDMTVFIRRDEVRAVVPAESGSIEIVDTHGGRFELAMNDNFAYKVVYDRIIAWRMGTHPA